MFSHIHLGVTDLQRSFGFYRAVLHHLGLELKFYEPGNGWAAWKAPDDERPLFLIGRPFNGETASAGNGQMTAFVAKSRERVDRCHAAALAAGAQNEGEPGLRPHYHANYYGAYFRDPDGNKICICCHDPDLSVEPTPTR